MVGARWSVALACLVVAAVVPATAAGNVIVTTRIDVPIIYDEYAREETVYEMDAAVGLGALLGYGFELADGRAALVLEAGGGYIWSFDPYERGTGHVIGGAQLGFGNSRLLTSIYFHLGWGASEGQDGDALLQRRGLFVDFGLAAMFRIARIVALGVRIGYNALAAETGSGMHTTHWIVTGIQTAFAF